MRAITASVCIRGSRPATLPRALDSVLRQGRSDIEVLVGDEPGTLAGIVEGFNDPRVRHRPFAERPEPTAHARALLNEARGRYLVLMDDDDRWLPGFLDATIARLDADPQLGIAFTNFFYDAAGCLCTRDWALAEGRHDEFLTAVLRGAPLGLSFAVMRLEVWEDGERRHPLCDDATVDGALWLRAADAGWPFYFLRERLAVYRMHPGQMSHRAELVRERAIRMWESFSFDDPEAERLRRLRLGEALLERANLRIRQRRFAAALDDLRRASAVSTKSFGEREVVALLGLRRAAARLLARHVQLARPAFAVWPALARFDQIR
jgi:glycosyltransferase involved in cell wall biosynthesis